MQRAGMEEMLRLFDCARQCDAEVKIDLTVMARDGGSAVWEKPFARPMESRRSWKCDCGFSVTRLKLAAAALMHAVER
ncbi:hypothetical protein E2542_SST17143 [Spatholobus suberectus]|nr:hypothetical protein E2542_SST17143 [Spatholobus suberectus]